MAAATGASAAYTPPTYKLELRERRTLRLIGELQGYSSVSWTRSELELGKFDLSAADVALGYTAPELLRQYLLVVWCDRHDGLGWYVEFAGPIRRQGYNRFTRIRTIGGPDLKWFLTIRKTRPDLGHDTDDLTAVAAETAMTHYVDHNLLNPVETNRAISNALQVPFVILPSGADAPVGETVSYSARDQRLLDVLIELGRAGLQSGQVGGGVTHEVRLTLSPQLEPLGYQYQVQGSRPLTTLSEGASAVTFSTAWQDIKSAVYEEDFTAVPTAVYVQGSGSGASRAETLVRDLDSADADFYIEEMTDGRNATTDAQRQTIGEADLATLKYNAVTVTDLAPLLAGPWRYRTHYDVGHDVTYQVPELGVELLIRVGQATVSLQKDKPEDIKLTLGIAKRSLDRTIAALARRTTPVRVQ